MLATTSYLVFKILSPASGGRVSQGPHFSQQIILPNRIPQAQKVSAASGGCCSAFLREAPRAAVYVVNGGGQCRAGCRGGSNVSSSSGCDGKGSV